MTSDPDGTEPVDADVSARLSNLEERLGAVEEVLAALSSSPAPPPPPPPPTATPLRAPGPALPGPSVPTVPADTESPPRSRSSPPPVTAEMALRWVGVVLVFLAALFLLSTAISRGWIGPKVQLGLATLGGVALVATGVHVDRRWGGGRSPRTRAWSLALTNTGVVVLAACAGAAHGWLDLIGVGPAVACVAVVLALALALADWFPHESLAISGLAGALVVPGVIGAYDEFGDVGTGAWLLFLVIVTMALAGRYRWSVPRLLGLVVIGPFMVVLTQEFVDVTDSLLAVIQGMIAVAGLLWWLAPWVRPALPPLRSIDTRLVFVVPGLVWLASSGLWATTDRERALVAVIAAIGFGVVSGLLWWQRTTTDPAAAARQLLFGHLVGVSSLITIALALWFEGPALLSALTVQALGTTVLVTRADDELLDINAVVLSGVVGLWTAAGLVDGIDNGLEVAEGVVYLLVVVASAVVAWLIRDRDLRIAGLAAVASWSGLLAWVMAVLRPLAQGQMLVSIVWAALGVVLVIVGLGVGNLDVPAWPEARHRWRNQIKSVGLATLAATVVKLVTIDLAEVETIWRALLFAVVGVGLLRLGYSMGLLEGSDESGATDEVPLVNGDDEGDDVTPSR